jgi:hypothetical protein
MTSSSIRAPYLAKLLFLAKPPTSGKMAYCINVALLGYAAVLSQIAFCAEVAVLDEIAFLGKVAAGVISVPPARRHSVVEALTSLARFHFVPKLLSLAKLPSSAQLPLVSLPASHWQALR